MEGPSTFCRWHQPGLGRPAKDKKPGFHNQVDGRSQPVTLKGHDPERKDRMNKRFASALIAFGLGMTGPALAHTDLVKSSPAEGASVAPPKTIVLTFSEKVASAFSGFDLAMAD